MDLPNHRVLIGPIILFGCYWSSALASHYYTAAARAAPRHDQRSLSGVYDAYVPERCISESEDTTIDIRERCISQPERSAWRCVKSSSESREDENELGCGIRPKMNVSDRIFGCFGNTNIPELATVTILRSLPRPFKWRPFC